MRYLRLIFILSFGLSAFADNKIKGRQEVKAVSRTPSTVADFESHRNDIGNDKNKSVLLKHLAEKYYTLYKPNARELIKYYATLKPHLPVHLKKQVIQREQIYLELSTSKNVNDYSRAQKILSLRKQNSSISQSDYDILSLSLIESYFSNTKPELVKEEAWIFRMNLRHRVYPEHEFAIIPKYLSLFPRTSTAKQKARYLREYIISDYRPESGSADFEDVSVSEIEQLIKSVLDASI